ATFTPLPFAAHWLPGVGEELRSRLEHFENLAVIGVHLSERSEGRVQASGRVTYRLRDEDAGELVHGIARAADLLFAAGATEVYPQLHGAPRLAPGDQRGLVDSRFGPGDLRLEAFHPLGTARMGSDPGDSAVAPSRGLSTEWCRRRGRGGSRPLAWATCARYWRTLLILSAANSAAASGPDSVARSRRRALRSR